MFDPRKFLNLDQTEHRTIFDNSANVWDALKQIGSYLQFRLKPAVHGRVLGRPFISENVFVGDRVVLGNSSEFKNSIIFNDAQIPHFNYVGDSVIGYKAHLGAGVILSNVRLDRKEISVKSES